MEKDKLSNNTGNNFNNYNHDRRDFIKYLGLLAISVPTLSSCDYLFGTTLSSECQPISGGTINPSSGNYDKDVVVEIIAIPSAGYRFDHWEGSVSGQSSAISLTMDKSKNVIAYFTKTYILNVSTNPSRGGTVVPSSSTYDVGESVTLIATASNYYSFSGWGGDISGSSNNITIMMDSDKNVIASFTQINYSLQTIANPNEGGNVSPAYGSYPGGSNISLTATPAQGFVFRGWDISNSTSNILDVFMDTNKVVTAFFSKLFTLNAIVSPQGAGIIIPGSGTYIDGEKVTLLADDAIFPYAFSSWTNTDNNSANPTTVTMNSDKNIVATYIQLNPEPAQTLTGRYDGHVIRTPFNLQAGQWVEGTIQIGRGVYLSILDPTYTPIIDLGYQTESTFVFQAQVTGTYYLNVAGMSYVITSWPYTINYNIYS